LKIKKETKIGLLVIGSILIAVWGFNLLKGRNVFNRSITMYAVYSKVDGLTPSCPVKVNGFKIGQVTRMEFMQGDTLGRILVSFRIDNRDVKIPTDSKARIMSSDLLGSKEISLVFGKSHDIISDGDTLKSEVEANLQQQVNELVAPLKVKVENLIGQVDTVVTSFKAVFDEKGMDNIQAGLSSLRRSIQNFEQATFNVNALLVSEKSKISNIFSNIESISANLKNNNKTITSVLDNLKNVTDSVKKARIASTINNANIAIQRADSILTQINSGQGSIGKLIKDESFYNMLDSAAYNLNELLVDVKKHPDEYVHINLIKVGTKREKEAKDAAEKSKRERKKTEK
jgi:phospholipid/cholesterol/gamma-HCH transport system substrate-binding protein